MRQRVENVQDIFRVSPFSSSSNSSSPEALAHERSGVREYFHHRLTPLSSGCILLYTRVCRELVRVMAIFWTSWLVATNMTPFAMTFHNRLQAAERMRETSCLCAKRRECMASPSLFLHFFCQLVFPCSYLIRGTIPTSVLVLVENIFTPLYMYYTPVLWYLQFAND